MDFLVDSECRDAPFLRARLPRRHLHDSPLRQHERGERQTEDAARVDADRVLADERAIDDGVAENQPLRALPVVRPERVCRGRLRRPEALSIRRIDALCMQ